MTVESPFLGIIMGVSEISIYIIAGENLKKLVSMISIFAVLTAFHVHSVEAFDGELNLNIPRAAEKRSLGSKKWLNRVNPV
ncbi:hypothetical protein BC351_22050 [Paenibacillus ferrarius]|uniref:Uncharacterized protein n=2 Tax=Paenibacillus ferrarius TaxID=1469647 RepID=A0A1V4HMW0_9BACL|nr:hypothetical protein BC351_22050 [Paenibacillus ferrarius]